MANEILLLEDVDNLGRSGDIVRVKPGFARNFLLPNRKAVFADENAKRIQARLQEERAKQAAEDRKASEKIAAELEKKTYTIEVKVDPDGHMYGSVSLVDIMKFLANDGYDVAKKSIQLPHAIKKIGVYTIDLKLAEDVPASFQLKVIAEGGEHTTASVEENAAPADQESSGEEA